MSDNMPRNFFKFYKVYRTTATVDDDIRLLKKINNLLLKRRRTGLDRYESEVINIIKTTCNLVNYTKECRLFIRRNIIDKEHLPMFDKLSKRLTT